MSSALDDSLSRARHAPPNRGVDPVTDDRTRTDLLAQIEALQHRLSTISQIEQAKGALMVVYGLTEEAAFALLGWYSDGSKARLTAIAAGLTIQPEPEPLGDEASQRLTELLNTIAATAGP